MLGRAVAVMALGSAAMGCTPRVFFAKSGLSDTALFPIEERGKVGYIDRAGRVAIVPRFDAAGEFFGGVAEVVAGGEAFFIDRSGARVAKGPDRPPAGREWEMEKGPCRVVEHNECSGTVSRVVPKDHPALAGIDEWDLVGREQAAAGFARCRYRLGGRLTPFVEVGPFREGLSAVSDGRGWGYVDSEGKVAVELRFAGAGPFGEGVAPVKDGGAWLYIDKWGKQAMEGRFDEATGFGQGLAHVRRGAEHFWIERTGRVIFRYEEGR